IPAFTPDMTLARSAAVQFGGSAAAVAAVPISVAPAITPAPMRLRKNIGGSLVSWVIGLCSTWTDTTSTARAAWASEIGRGEDHIDIPAVVAVPRVGTV